ncbi:MAG: Peptidoglycan-N-acetylglucosamine deacetylase [Planctomycetes bacterium ADurb.Bin126]|nr:MAG: Peptidoglycan-N-acetylglucosamine deacetylase [Planctomycetes bacterium ADurb.Bin126]HOD83383.1 DUF3473 domain-containing protein [Phycisphaerae bacterium]HQL73181.1 DUF3473 domain-containing protein [Phycisphaerae bacterium]
MSMTGDNLAHHLSFDVEEFFQVEGAAKCVDRDDWAGFASRLDEPVGRILDLLAERGVRATFFVLGWVACQRGELVRRIAQAGHEVASHGMSHHMLARLGPDAFRQELRESRRILEDLSGQEVVGFRAPTFSIMHRTAWALDVLIEEGWQYDSSVFPVRHDRYGVPDAPTRPHWARAGGEKAILELPPLTRRVLRGNWPVGGGGYLRLLPLWVIKGAVAAAQRCGLPAMIYLHPWELDPDQPVLKMGRLGTWRHRVNLARTHDKLRRLLEAFRFTSVRDNLPALRAGDWPTWAYGK